jgi:PAS domain S-box-containing protein
MATAASSLARDPLAKPPARLTEAHLAEAQRLAAIGSCEIDIRTRKIVCSPEMLRILGWEDNRAPDVDRLRASIHPDDRSTVETWLAEAHNARQAPAECSFRILRGHAVRTVLGRARIAVSDGLKIVGSVQDITEYAMALRASEENALLRRGMFENATWGIFQTTADGHYLSVNAALARIYGYDSPQMMVLALTDIGSQLYVEPERRKEFVRLMKADGKVSGFESQVRRRDGAVIWISESCREVRATDGRLLFYEGTVEEITARKRGEEELRIAKEEAEAANRAKSAFLNTMSHELRTPLNAVLGFAEVLRDELFGPLGNPRYKDYVLDIHKSGAHLLDIIGDILDLTKIESGNLSLSEQTVDMADVAKTCERLMADSAREKRMAIEIAMPDTPILLHADGRRILQIVINLMSNAIKFSPDGGSVGLSVRIAHDGACVLTVVDLGIGMTPAEVEKALQPFQQVDNALSRKFEGTGLGLTLTKSLVALHGGTLAIDSTPKVGTTVIVRLPAARVIPAA